MPRISTNLSHGLSRAQFLKLASAASVATMAPIPPVLAAERPLLARSIPKSKDGEQLPVMGLGTAQDFGARRDIEDKTQVLKILLEGGGKIVDTAASYARGSSEELIGELLEQDGLRSKAFIATKFGERGRENGIESMDRSFKRLRTDHIDLMFVHNMVDVDTHLPALREYKDQGRIRYFGVTSTGRRQDNLTQWMDELDFVEFAYAADNRGAEQRLLPMAADKGVAVLVALPLGRGRPLSAMKGKDVPEWATEELGCHTYAQLLLKFVVSHSSVTAAIPGTNNPKHMIENLAAGRGPMADTKQRARIAALWD
jgi:aryl-alcohol dehydrogenase-like predicted oxidoreductase